MHDEINALRHVTSKHVRFNEKASLEYKGLPWLERGALLILIILS